MENGGVEAVTSIISLLEALVRPIALGRKDSAEYRDFLTGPPSFPASSKCDPGGKGCYIACYMKSAPHAVQLAAALEFNAKCFLTNDDRLRKVQELEVIVLERWLQEQYNGNAP
ncbi:MAG TPA: hypothetical protein EYP55_05745 [Anaerolineae bacterium]|nr:hypothetical protein [Anaerolineae bacterium]